jgi:hypothetical protein
MKKKRALAASRDPEYEVQSSLPKNSIIFNTGNSDEMLRVAKDGFYVRGVRVPVDDREAETVYNAFKEFLVYHNLARSY